MFSKNSIGKHLLTWIMLASVVFALTAASFIRAHRDAVANEIPAGYYFCQDGGDEPVYVFNAGTAQAPDYRRRTSDGDLPVAIEDQRSKPGWFASTEPNTCYWNNPLLNPFAQDPELMSNRIMYSDLPIGGAGYYWCSTDFKAPVRVERGSIPPRAGGLTSDYEPEWVVYHLSGQGYHDLNHSTCRWSEPLNRYPRSR